MSIELADAPLPEAPLGPSIRDSLESAVAAHGTSSDVSSAVAGAVEQRDTQLRQRDRQARPGSRDWQAEVAETRRQHVRDAVQQHRGQASQQASQPQQPTNPAAVPVPGAPPTWDSNAKAHWDSLDPAVRVAIQRDHATLKAGHDEKFQEFEKVLGPARQVYSQHGLNDQQAIAQLFSWEAALRNPQTQREAYERLGQEYGITQPQQQQMPQASPEAVNAELGRLEKFAGARPAFEQVRGTMGVLLERQTQRFVQADGSVNLDELYKAACKVEGLTGRPEPSPRPAPPTDRRSTVRQSLTAAMRR